MSGKLLVRHRSADVIHWTATASVAVDYLQTVGALVGVCQTAGSTGDVVPIAVAGIWNLTKATSVTITQGTKMFASSTGAATTASAGNVFCGHAWETSSTGDGLIGVGLKGWGVND